MYARQTIVAATRHQAAWGVRWLLPSAMTVLRPVPPGACKGSGGHGLRIDELIGCLILFPSCALWLHGSGGVSTLHILYRAKR